MMQKPGATAETRGELGRSTLGVLIICGLILGTVWILLPFLGAFVWAVMVVVATWPMLLRAERAFGGRRWAAVLLMTVLLLGVLIVPLAVALNAVISNVGSLGGLLERLSVSHLPAPPAWVAGVPLAGERVADAWAEAARLSGPELVARAEPFARDAAKWLLSHAGGFAGLMLQFLLIVILSAVLYSGGEGWADWVRGFGRRLAEEKGERMTVLAAQAIRGVALGVVVTAIVQSVLGGIGLAIAGVPYAPVLTAIMFMLCIAQLGPLPVLLGATIWVFANQGNAWGAFMVVWTLVVGLLDNVLRPLLIRRGADLPLLLIIAGVIGGLIAFGVVGIFVGPVLLAVSYTLADDWVKEGRAAPAEPAAS